MKRDFIQLKPGYIHRERIDALLEKGLNYSLISVVAGPGYGKTMAVAGFAKKTPMRLIWLRLQETDNDIYRFWTRLTAAAQPELPALAEELKKTAMPVVLGVYDTVSQLFAGELENGPILMVLDNFEFLSSPHVLKLIHLLIRAELSGLHIIVISNEKIPIGAIVPSSGQLRISMEDLGFTRQEAEALFRENCVSLPTEEIDKILENTGHWPLALHLICVNQSGEGARGLQEKTYQQLAAELFDQHYYSAYSPEMRTLLVQLSCFSRFPLELIRMLTQGEETVAIVDDLSRNVFISYDYTLELFQFQTMYRAFLTHRQALISRQQLEAMHAFMGDWYLDHGYYLEALDSFLIIEAHDKYLNTLFLLPKVRRGIPIAPDILHNLERFPGAYTLANPTLDYYIAVLLLRDIQTERARGIFLSLAEKLESAEKNQEQRRLLGDIYVILSDIGIFLNESVGLDYIKKAAELLPDGCRVKTRDVMLVGNNNAFYLPDGEPGQLERMVAFFHRFSGYADRVSNGSGYGFEWLFAGQAAFLTEQFDKAREYSLRAVAKAQINQQHDIICNAYWDLMRIELYAGDHKAARHWLDEITAYADIHRIGELYELRDCAASWFYIRMEDNGRVAPWVKNSAPIEQGHLLDVGRNRIILIYYLMVEGRVSEAYAEITHLEDLLRFKGRWHERLLLQMYQSLRLLDGGEKQEAVGAFKLAYDMVYHNNITAVFIEFGKQTQRMIRAVRSQGEIPFDLDWLDMVYKKAGAFEKRAATMKKAYHHTNAPSHSSSFNLNAKEKEILTYIAQGMTRSEISVHMNTSMSNVKRYINNIYTKLGALNRADAIYIATLNGIVDNPDVK